MLKKEQNDLLTQTGPGMPMGRLFRSHWLPVLLASELPENECPPVRVNLLSERHPAIQTTPALAIPALIISPLRRAVHLRPDQSA
jgi:phthalate 4,5-dioxygenase oxygenase subunit